MARLDLVRRRACAESKHFLLGMCEILVTDSYKKLLKITLSASRRNPYQCHDSEGKCEARRPIAPPSSGQANKLYKSHKKQKNRKRYSKVDQRVPVNSLWRSIRAGFIRLAFLVSFEDLVSVGFEICYPCSGEIKQFLQAIR
jgi:hypothetical protein